MHNHTLVGLDCLKFNEIPADVLPTALMTADHMTALKTADLMPALKTADLMTALKTAD